MNSNHIVQAKTIGYVRSGTQDPDSEKSLLEQVSRIKAAGVNTIICDFASASDVDRQGLKILLKLVKKGKIGKIVVTRWDRLARSSELCIELLDTFKLSNTRILFLDQGEVCFSVKESDSWSFLNSIFQKQNC